MIVSITLLYSVVNCVFSAADVEQDEAGGGVHQGPDRRGELFA